MWHFRNRLLAIGSIRLPRAYRSYSLWLSILATVALMWGLKYHYSTAGAAQLDWILAPTAGMVQGITGTSYTRHAELGYVSENEKIIIAPACAGLNFMIMAFGLTAVTGLARCRLLLEKMYWLVLMLIGAYLATIGINTLRIILSVSLFENGVSMGWLTPERVHRIVGIGIYFGFLGLYSVSVKPIIPLIQRRAIWSGVETSLEPVRRYGGIWGLWGWYLLGAVAVPIVHQVYRGRPPAAPEHYLTICLVSLLICGAADLFSRMGRRDETHYFDCGR